VLDEARNLGLVPSDPTSNMSNMPHGVEIARAGREGQLVALEERLRRVERNLETKIAPEGRSDQGRTLQQIGLVNFYVRAMKIELMLAKLQAKGIFIDLTSLARAIEAIGGLTADFVATVEGLQGKVTDTLKRATQAIRRPVRRVVVGFKMIVASVRRQARRASGGRVPGDRFQDFDAGPQMIVVPPGEFMMGSPEGEGPDEERHQHKVELKAVGISIGGDFRTDTHIDLSEEGVRRLLQQELARIAEAKGVTIAPLRAVLEKLLAAQTAIEEIPKRLAAAADELLALRQALQRLRNDRPELAAIRGQALALIDAGDLDAARAALNRGRQAARALREEMSRSEAEFLADEARIDHLQLAYRDAAQKYAEAAALVAPFGPDAEWQYVLRQASELYHYGNEFGDNHALVEAIDVYRRAMTLAPRRPRPLDWAMTQNNLGTALSRLGERESLGNALMTLGERESGTARLEEAVAAYRAALEEWTRARVPLDWARTQNDLGNALRTLGERESGTARLEEAVAAYRAALEEWTRARVRHWHDITQRNLARCITLLEQRRNP
jgi:tetratricopeptide (TPR) repeat protein